jgi:hypothetical protein
MNLEYDIPIFKTLPEILRDDDSNQKKMPELKDIYVEKLYQLEPFYNRKRILQFNIILFIFFIFFIFFIIRKFFRYF